MSHYSDVEDLGDVNDVMLDSEGNPFDPLGISITRPDIRQLPIELVPETKTILQPNKYITDDNIMVTSIPSHLFEQLIADTATILSKSIKILSDGFQLIPDTIALAALFPSAMAAFATAKSAIAELANHPMTAKEVLHVVRVALDRVDDEFNSAAV